MDDLLDLNWSSSPSSAKTTSTSTPPINAQQPTQKPSSTAFDFLAQPASRSGTPNYYSAPAPLRASTPNQPFAPVPLSGANGGGENVQRLGLGAAVAPLRGSGTTTPSSAIGTPTIPQPATVSNGATSGAGASGGLDVFSSLLSISSSGTGTGTGTAAGAGGGGGRNMTMAEKQAAMAEERRRKEEEDKKRFEAEGAFWDNLGGSSGSGSGSGNGSKSQAARKADGLDELLGASSIAGPSSSTMMGAARVKSATNGGIPILAPSPAPGAGAAPKPKPTPSSAGTFWNSFDDTDDLLISSGPAKATTTKTSRSPVPPSDPFDFDALAATVAPSVSSVPSHLNGIGKGSRNGGSGMRTPVSDFDFGDRIDREEDDDDDDILGDLGKPVTARPAPSAAPAQFEVRAVDLAVSRNYR